MKGSISLPTLLGVTFIILKLCNVIAWSWVWVLSPFWIAGCLWIVGAALYVCLSRKGRTTNTRYKSKWQEKLEALQSRNQKPSI